MLQAMQRQAQAQAQAQQPVGPKEWAGLKDMPAKTQASLNEVLSRMTSKGQTEMTVVFVGKQGAGKSSTLNSVLNERVAAAAPFQPETLRPLLAARRAVGFTISLLDTPGLLEGDAVSQRGMSSVKLAMKDRKVHAVVYMDRLDSWRVDNSDRAIFKALADNFGMDIWERTVLGFSHGQLSPTQLPYDQFVEARANELRSAIRDTLNAPHLALPHAVVENGSRCATNKDGEKVLPDKERTAWVPKFVSTLADVATRLLDPMEFDEQKTYSKDDPNKKRRLLILPMLALQVFVLRPFITNLIRADIKKGKGGRV